MVCPKIAKILITKSVTRQNQNSTELIESNQIGRCRLHLKRNDGLFLVKDLKEICTLIHELTGEVFNLFELNRFAVVFHSHSTPTS